MSKLRKSARMQECQIRLPTICNFNPEKTILAHLGGAGMGRKHNDLFASFACSDCHDAIDGKIRTCLTQDDLKLAFFEGMQRTQQIWLDNGDILTK